VDSQAEVERLRARVAELERELADRTERANVAIAAAQDHIYWLDKWRIDPNRVLGSPAGRRAFALARQVSRVIGKIRRRARGANASRW